MIYKKNYNWVHEQLFLEVNDLAFLRLHREYQIPATKRIITKSLQKFVRPFWVIEKIGKLAYRLNILLHWKVHLVFTIAQLEFYMIGNLFKRQLSVQPPDLYVEQQSSKTDKVLWILKRVLRKRMMKKRKRITIKYLLRWKRWRTRI